MRRPLLAFLTVLSVVLSWATAADAGQSAKGSERHMEIVQVEGIDIF